MCADFRQGNPPGGFALAPFVLQGNFKAVPSELGTLKRNSDWCVVSWVVLSLLLHHSCTLPLTFVKFSVTLDTLSKPVLCLEKVRHQGVWLVYVYPLCVCLCVLRTQFQLVRPSNTSLSRLTTSPHAVLDTQWKQKKKSYLLDYPPPLSQRVSQPSLQLPHSNSHITQRNNLHCPHHN